MFGFGNNKNNQQRVKKPAQKSLKDNFKDSFFDRFGLGGGKKRPATKNFQSSNFQGSNLSGNKKTKECRYFAPTQEQAQELIKNNTSFAPKNLHQTLQNGFQKSSLQFQTFKNWLFSLISDLARITTLFLIFGFSLSLIYFTFLDNSFTIKNYTFTFSQGSYLSPEQVNTLSKVIQTQKQLIFLPQNQYWYINSPALTLSVREFLPQVKSVVVKDKTWSQKVELEIITEPTLITLGVFEKDSLKFWRVSKNGTILGQDKAGLNENLVMVKNPLSITNQDKTDFSQFATLENYNFKNNQPQLNRFYFSSWLKNLLTESNLQNFSLSFPSLNDEDVIVTLVNGSQIYFNSTYFDPAVQSRRFQSVLSTNLGDQNSVARGLEEGSIYYLDLRIPKRVFVCQKGSQCAN